MGTINIEFSDEDKVLFDLLNERSKKLVKNMNNKSITAQDILDEVKAH